MDKINDRMEADFSCLSRLRAILQKHGTAPFPVGHKSLSETFYSEDEYELEELLGMLVAENNKYGSISDNTFLPVIRQYSEWIGFDEDIAYILLMRDALLPYIFFCSRNRRNIYPWLISRRFLNDITKTQNVDDDIRLPLYEALEEGHIVFDDHAAYCKEGILPVLDEYPGLKSALLELLDSIKQNRIIVIESGYMGTIPMMLKALDDRVDFRLFTTAPFLYETYQDRIYCRKYEDIRKFETVYSQDLLLRYSSYRDGKFYVNVSVDEFVKSRSFAEIKMFAR